MTPNIEIKTELLKKCVQCGSCVLICPIYRVLQEEGQSPRGKLFFLKMMEEFPEQIDEELEQEYAEAIFNCTLCGRCEETCSSDTNILEIYKEVRKKKVDVFPKLKQLSEKVLEKKNVYGMDNNSRAEFWLFDLYEEFPDIDERIYQEGKTADTIFFVGCLMSFRGRHSNVLKSIITVLEKIGEDYLLLGGAEVCCGHPLDLVGKVQEADKVREQNNLVFKKVGAKTIITDCPGCLEAIVDHHKVGKDVRILHITEFFDEKITTVPKKLNIRLKYHDPCELFRNSKVTEAPRSLLRKMGIELVEMEPSCCGGGGMLRVSKDSVASEIMQQRMTKEKLQEEPTEVVTCCPSCLEQYELNGIITKDIAEWLVKALDDSKEEEE